MIEIPSHMLHHYLQNVTVAYFDPEHFPPDDVSGYASCIMNMRLLAEQFGDLEALKLAFEYLLSHPEIDASAFAGDRYPYDDDEVREIVRYARATIWPDAGPVPERGPDVRLVNLSLQEWRALRGGHG